MTFGRTASQRPAHSMLIPIRGWLICADSKVQLPAMSKTSVLLVDANTVLDEKRMVCRA
jgi:hypothetical protein